MFYERVNMSNVVDITHCKGSEKLLQSYINSQLMFGYVEKCTTFKVVRKLENCVRYLYFCLRVYLCK
jgi:hypothetical protein